MRQAVERQLSDEVALKKNRDEAEAMKKPASIEEEITKTQMDKEAEGKDEDEKGEQGEGVEAETDSNLDYTVSN